MGPDVFGFVLDAVMTFGPVRQVAQADIDVEVFADASRAGIARADLDQVPQRQSGLFLRLAAGTVFGAFARVDPPRHRFQLPGIGRTAPPRPHPELFDQQDTVPHGIVWQEDHRIGAEKDLPFEGARHAAGKGRMRQRIGGRDEVTDMIRAAVMQLNLVPHPVRADLRARHLPCPHPGLRPGLDLSEAELKRPARETALVGHDLGRGEHGPVRAAFDPCLQRPRAVRVAGRCHGAVEVRLDAVAAARHHLGLREIRECVLIMVDARNGVM